MGKLQCSPLKISRRATFQNGTNPGRAGEFSWPFSSMKKRGHGSHSWIQIDRNGSMQVLQLDKGSLMRKCSLPGRDLRLLDPLFVYPSTILGREKAIVVSLEEIRCIIMADEVILLNSLDPVVLQFKSELCKRLQGESDQSEALAFEFRSLELVLELACTSLDAQVTELEAEVYPVLENLASTIKTIDLEHVRKLKSSLLALTHRVQKVQDEIEHLMDDDGDMAEMYLTQKKERLAVAFSPNLYVQHHDPNFIGISKSAPVSPVESVRDGHFALDRTSSRGSSKYESFRTLSNDEHIEELEMLLEAYFVVIDSILSKLLSLKEYIDDTEDFINIKLDNIRNQLIQLEMLLTAATFVTAVFAVVTGIFGMNFDPPFFDQPDNFRWVLLVTGIVCIIIYLLFLAYVKCKRVITL